MDPYRKAAGGGGSIDEPDVPFLSCCALVRAGVRSTSAFLEALCVGLTDAEVIQDLSHSSLEELRQAREVSDRMGRVVHVLGLCQLTEGVLCLDPGRSWWSESRIIAGLSARLGRVLVGIADEPFQAFGVRWWEQGKVVRSVLRVSGQVELEGPTMSEEVGVEISKLDASRVHAVLGMREAELAATLEPRLVIVRDHGAERMLG